MFSWLPVPSGIEFQLAERWVRAVRVRLPRSDFDGLRSAGIQIGARSYWFTRAELLDRWTRIDLPPPGPGGKEFLALETPPPRASSTSWWTPQSYLLNWRVSEGVFTSAIRWPASCALLLLALSGLCCRSGRNERAMGWLERFLGIGSMTAKDAPVSSVGRIVWLMAGLILMCATLLRLETADPYFFTRGDNRNEFAPSIVYGCRAAARERLPAWNPGEMLGSPSIDLGNRALTYPFTYICYGIARGLLHDEYRTLEVWAWFHLLLGYVATFAFASLVGLRPGLAASASLSFALCGYFAVLGRSWMSVPPIALWLPLWMLPLAVLQRREPGPAWVALTGLVMGLSFHAGNAQFWAYYALLFGFAAALMAATRRELRRRLLRVVPAFVLGVALAAPLLWPQLAWSRRLSRMGGLGGGALDYAPRLLMPSPIVDACLPDAFSIRADRYGDQFYSGTLLTGMGALAMAALIGAMLAFENGSTVLGQNGWAACALLTLLLVLGDRGFLWAPMSLLPGFSMFTLPLKLIPYFTFFAVVSGGLGLERVLAPAPRGPLLETLVFLAVGALLFHHCGLGLNAKDKIPLPYPPLEELLQAKAPAAVLDATQRVLPLAQGFDASADNLWSFSYSLPIHYGLYSVDGYDPLVWASPENLRVIKRMQREPIAAARAYGVKWALHRRTYAPPNITADPTNPLDMHAGMLDSPNLLALVQRRGRRIVQLPQVDVWELPDPDPLAFAPIQPLTRLPVAFDCNGAVVDTSKLGASATVVVNVLGHPNLRAFGDGTELPLELDDWDRVCVRVPAGLRSLNVRYVPPFGNGVALGVFLAILALGAARLLDRWSPLAVQAASIPRPSDSPLS
ncbi:MAG: hypothetical protein HY303_20075 [Candidatus Wallbacteria bacterium]|nr:hypothetical protein [Candidatus Wallbacteria bacterium]